MAALNLNIVQKLVIDSVVPGFWNIGVTNVTYNDIKLIIEVVDEHNYSATRIFECIELLCGCDDVKLKTMLNQKPSNFKRKIMNFIKKNPSFLCENVRY